MSTDFIFRDGVLAGKTAFVTGGATGIGNGVAHRLARAGANLIIASRTEEKCVKAAEEIAQKYGVKAIGRGMDVRNSSQVNEVFKDAVGEMGGSLDILVNNAAGNFYWPAEKLRDKLWLAVIEIDLNGTFYCSRAAFKYMKAKGGAIVNISSNLQKDGWIGMAPATSAKGGIDAMTKTLALEWARHGIRVNAVCPGPVVTEGVSKAFEKGGSFEELLHTIPLHRAGEPEEVGDFIVFITSSAGSWMTGAIVPFDGGEAISPVRGMPSVEQLHQAMEDRKEDRKKD